jgi:precorrin-6A/cobalt-precorrin-6A reductase
VKPDSGPPNRVWLIGGTQESAAVAQVIVGHGRLCLVTVTTESAQSLYPHHPLLTIRVGQLTAVELSSFIPAHAIAAIVDASHPFAVEISKLAIAAATASNLPYLRFERSTSPLPPTLLTPLSHAFPTFQAFLDTDLMVGQRVLLTVGYRPLMGFKPWQEKAKLFARILPSVTALEAAIAAGFTPDRLIALRPPIAAAVERALWAQWRISMVVTKASGVAGGEDVKQQVAIEMGVQLVVIERPTIDYPQQTSDLATVIEFCDRVFPVRSGLRVNL